MTPFDVAALGYHYPTETSVSELSAAIAEIDGEVARHMRRFVEAVEVLSLGEWEELHTATLDLSAPFVPYVGHVAWGENYRRGAFMADLQAAMRNEGIDLHGELPDHIEPILRYLAVTSDPLPDLMAVLPDAVAEMKHTLDRAAGKNPYRHLLAATMECAGNRPVSIGGRR